MWDDMRFPVFSPFTLVVMAGGLAILLRYRRSPAGWLGGLAFVLALVPWTVLELSEAFELRDRGLFDLLLRWYLSVTEAAKWCALGAIVLVAAELRRGEPAPRGPYSKGRWLGWILVPAGVSLLVLRIVPQGVERPLRDLEELWPLVLVFVVPLSILAEIFLLVFVYRMWRAIRGCQPRTSPGMAVGLLFVPVLNVYWVFQVYWGWTRDYNRYAKEKGLALPRMPGGVAVALCIFAIICVSPVLSGPLIAITLVLLGTFLSRACDGMNALARVEAEADPGALG